MLQGKGKEEKSRNIKREKKRYRLPKRRAGSHVVSKGRSRKRVLLKHIRKREIEGVKGEMSKKALR